MAAKRFAVVDRAAVCAAEGVGTEIWREQRRRCLNGDLADASRATTCAVIRNATGRFWCQRAVILFSELRVIHGA